ncbi:MAG: hypothetical protein AAF657_29985 [Acidobacteriota bacterium]
MQARITNSRPPRRRLPIAAWILLLLVSAGATWALQPTEAIQATDEIPEDTLLDVGIRILDPGLPEGDGYSLEQNGYYEDVRKSEARYIPVVLMETLQATGNWGAVRVVPAAGVNVDLSVKGRILSSSGRKLELEIRAVDSAGRRWLDKRYKHVADPSAYAEDRVGREPFQDVFNHIANDLLAARRKLEDDELRRIRSVTELRFAADLAPAAYGDYLGVDKKGQTVVERLPAEDDPIMERVARIRERDHLFVDTLTEYYANFQAQMSDPYDNWRRFSYEEEVATRKLKRQARMQQILGAVGILGGLLVDRDSRQADAIGDVAVAGGAIAIQMGFAKAQEAKIHREALRELASSFDSEVAPLLVDVEGQAMRLSGSVETQYLTWRQLMRDFFVAETGFPVDPNTGAPLPAAEAPEE